MKNKLTALGCLLLGWIIIAPAMANTWLWQLDKHPVKAAKTQSDLSQIARIRAGGSPVRFNLQQLIRLGVGDNLILPIDKSLYKVVIESLETHGNHSTSWIGRITSGSLSYPVIITKGPASIFVNAVTPKGTYSVQGDLTSGTMVKQSDLAKAISPGSEDFALMPSRSTPMNGWIPMVTAPAIMPTVTVSTTCKNISWAPTRQTPPMPTTTVTQTAMATWKR